MQNALLISFYLNNYYLYRRNTEKFYIDFRFMNIDYCTTHNIVPYVINENLIKLTEIKKKKSKYHENSE